MFPTKFLGPLIVRVIISPNLQFLILFAVIAIVELAERFSFYGSSVVFVCYCQFRWGEYRLTSYLQANYIQQPLPPGSRTGAGGLNGQAGALGMGQQTANGLNTFYSFWCYITPLFGAYIADAHVR